MKSIRYFKIYIILFVYLLLSLILDKITPSIFNLGVNPVFLSLLALYLYKETNNNHGRFVKNINYIKKMLIFSLFYIIVYLLLGFIFGFASSPYSHNFITIIKNLWQIIVPIVGIEYIRSVLVNKNSKNKTSIILATILFILLEINLNIFFRSITTLETAFKYISSRVLPLIFSQMIYSYLSLKGSYKLVLIYRLLIELMYLLTPIYPDLDWFLSGIVGILIPVIIYVLFRYDYDKKERSISRIRLKKQNPVIYIPTLTIVIIFVSFMAGLFKYEPIAIVSNSMNPIFYRGDVVVFEKLDVNELKNLTKNNIIVYGIDNQYVVHRIIDINQEGEKLFFKTKGDANNSPDLNLVSEEQVIGVYKFSIKYIGYPSVWLNEIFNNQQAKVEIK